MSLSSGRVGIRQVEGEREEKGRLARTFSVWNLVDSYFLGNAPFPLSMSWIVSCFLHGAARLPSLLQFSKKLVFVFHSSSRQEAALPFG
jgi:hypothetical protein